MSLLIPMKAGALKKGGYLQIKGHPCKVASISTSKTGKHGHAKMNIVGIDCLTGKKYEDMTPTSHNIYVPEITRNEYQLIAYDEYLSLMDDAGLVIEDVEMPEEQALADKISESMDSGEKDVLVTVLTAPVGDSETNAVLKKLVIDVRVTDL